MKKKTKVSKHLIALMCLGTAGLSGAASVVLLRPTGSPSNPETRDITDTKIDLADYDGKVSEKLSNGANEVQLLRAFLSTNETITKPNDLIVTNIDPVNRTFEVRAKENSYYYAAQSYASCGWDLPTISTNWTDITGTDKLVSRLQIFDDTEVGRLELLKDLAAQYPLLDVNQLYIDSNSLDQEKKAAEIRVVENSVVYNNAFTGTIIAGWTASIELSYTNPTLNQSALTATPVFKFKGNDAIVPTYEITPTPAAPLAWTSTTGVLKLTANVEYAGGLFSVTATHIDNGNTYTARAFIYVQAYKPYADLNITCNKTVLNQSNQTATFTFKNGTTNLSTGTTWSISQTADSTLTWTGNTNSATATLKINTLNVVIPGGTYVITATINGYYARYTIYVEPFLPKANCFPIEVSLWSSDRSWWVRNATGYTIPIGARITFAGSYANQVNSSGERAITTDTGNFNTATTNIGQQYPGAFTFHSYSSTTKVTITNGGWLKVGVNNSTNDAPYNGQYYFAGLVEFVPNVA